MIEMSFNVSVLLYLNRSAAVDVRTLYRKTYILPACVGQVNLSEDSGDNCKELLKCTGL